MSELRDFIEERYDVLDNADGTIANRPNDWMRAGILLNELERESAAQAVQIAALQGALEFYSNDGDWPGEYSLEENEIMLDRGETARAALAGNPPDLVGEPNPTKSALTEFIREGERIEAACSGSNPLNKEPH